MAAAAQERPSLQSPLEFVTPNDWVLIKAGARQMKFMPGEALIQQDSPGGTMYLLDRGTARIEASGAVLAHIGAGQQAGLTPAARG